MNCPRCRLPVFVENFQPGEHVLSCNMCGYYSARLVAGYTKEIPFFRGILKEPMGVIVSEDGNRQYFSLSQRSKMIKEHNATGYTFNKDGTWYLMDLRRNLKRRFSRLTREEVF